MRPNPCIWIYANTHNLRQYPDTVIFQITWSCPTNTYTPRAPTSCPQGSPRFPYCPLQHSHRCLDRKQPSLGGQSYTLAKLAGQDIVLQGHSDHPYNTSGKLSTPHIIHIHTRQRGSASLVGNLLNNKTRPISMHRPGNVPQALRPLSHIPIIRREAIMVTMVRPAQHAAVHRKVV